MPEHDEMVATWQETAQKGAWYRPTRCSVCTRFTWFRPIALKEPVGVPEPRREWLLCNPCHEALLVEMDRSPILSPLRVRIAMALVVAERSPTAYPTMTNEQQKRQREFFWIMVFVGLFGLWHLIIFVVLLALPR